MSKQPSTASWLASLPEAERAAFLESLTPDERSLLLYDWRYWARETQLPPDGDWQIWLILAGRGFGKTRTGAEWVRVQARTCQYVNLIGATADDARDIMVEGESGILAICPQAERPLYKKNDRKLVWPSGATSLIFTADEPERLRGKQHEGLWADELAAWRYPESWDQAMLGLRLGTNPRAVVTTTPKPTPIIRELMSSSMTVVTRGSTYDNLENLAPPFIDKVIKKYEGTRLGRQELNAEILDDVEGALWKRAQIDALRVSHPPEMVRIVVSVDPAVTNTDDSDETGIIVAGVGADGHGYVLNDASLRGSPNEWATAAIAEYYKFRADRLIAEVNNGGDMVEFTIRTVDRSVAYKQIHASRGKQTRAEPVASLYEQGEAHHVGCFPVLEDQMCQWVPGDPTSPDRVDATVWALTELLLPDEEQTRQAMPLIRGVRGR
jgi:phage terminase large subunit-like protein